MNIPLVQFSWCGKRIYGIPADHIINATPGPDNADGWRYRDLAEWLAGNDHHQWPGILVMDPDVAADRDDLEAITRAASELPADVHTGLTKNWPASTGRSAWMWSFRPGRLGYPIATQDETEAAVYFATDLTYLPQRLLDLALPVMPSWCWAEGDVRLSELAIQHGIPAHTVPGCRPKHLHF